MGTVNIRVKSGKKKGQVARCDYRVNSAGNIVGVKCHITPKKKTKTKAKRRRRRAA
jgi:hypothetical protein